LAYTLYYYR
jgi:hypothetical protein